MRVLSGIMRVCDVCVLRVRVRVYGSVTRLLRAGKDTYTQAFLLFHILCLKGAYISVDG